MLKFKKNLRVFFRVVIFSIFIPIVFGCFWVFFGLLMAMEESTTRNWKKISCRFLDNLFTLRLVPISLPYVQ